MQTSVLITTMCFLSSRKLQEVVNGKDLSDALEVTLMVSCVLALQLAVFY